MNTNTLPRPSYRALLTDRETHRDAIAECENDPDHLMGYFLPSHREGFANADQALRAFIAEQRAAGRVLCPISLEWREPGDTDEDRESAAEYAASGVRLTFAENRAPH